MDLLSFRKWVLLLAVVAMDNGCFVAGDQEVCANGISNYTLIERERVNETKTFTGYRIEIYSPDCSGFFKTIRSFFTDECDKRSRIVPYTEKQYFIKVVTFNVIKCCPGFVGNDISCSEGCGSGTYGASCTFNCSCPYQAFENCDSDTGYCLCKPGYMGLLCGEVCPVGRYGLNCTHNCMCQNNSTCDRETGTCNCSSAPGWTGSSCEEECDVGTYGEDCQHICTCNGNQTCDHVTGNCTCMAGLTGPDCTEECTNFTYGVDCKKNCTCMENTTESCNKATGHCTCKAGYMGDACDEVCIPGFYGDACENNCSNVCKWTNYCHHVSGTCICLGSKGQNCSIACGQHEYGPDCNETCTCTWERTIGGRCDNLTGRCQCREGYSGANCQVLVEVSTDTPHSDAMKPGWWDFVVANWTYFVIGAGVVVFLVAMTIAVVCYCRLNRRKRSNKEQTEEHLSAAFANQEHSGSKDTSKDTAGALQDTVCNTSGLEVSDYSKPNRNASDVEEHKAAAITSALSKESDSMSTDIQTEKPLTRTYEEPPDSVELKHISDDVENSSAEYLEETVRGKTETTDIVNIKDEDDYDVHGNQTSITSDKLNEFNTFKM